MPPETGEEALVFVYGAQRQGFGNHYLLDEGARALGPARLARAYALYALKIPFAIKDQSVCPLIGELYAVTAATLARLDELEEHPTWYCRELVEVMDGAGAARQAWLYFYPEPKGQLAPSGDFAQAVRSDGRPGQD